MERLQGFVSTVQRMATSTYHLNPLATISIYGRRYQARHYCACANRLLCMPRLRASSLTLQLKLLHPCVSFREINYRNALQQVLCRLWSIYYLYSSNSFSKYCSRNHVYWISSKKDNEIKSFSKTDRFI